MVGGIIQLTSTGIENMYIMGNPQITFFKSVYCFRELGSHAQVLIGGSRNRGQRKKNAEARRRFLSLTNILLTITNFERLSLRAYDHTSVF